MDKSKQDGFHGKDLVCLSRDENKTFLVRFKNNPACHANSGTLLRIIKRLYNFSVSLMSDLTYWFRFSRYGLPLNQKIFADKPNYNFQV